MKFSRRLSLQSNPLPLNPWQIRSNSQNCQFDLNHNRARLFVYSDLPLSTVQVIRNLKSVWVCLALAICFASYATISVAQQAANEWLTEGQPALDRAAKNNKDVLMLFTGSDWCPPCKKLEEEVLSQAEFMDGVKANFVLVKFDFLRQQPVLPAQEAENSKWSQQWGIEGYPTIVLVDRQKKPFGFIGYEPGGAPSFLKRLEDMRQKRMRRDDCFAAAERAEGAERAKLLDQGLAEIGEEIANVYYEDLVKEIVAIDASDELGLRTKWNSAAENEIRKLLVADIRTMSRLEKPENVIAFIDQAMTEWQFPIEQKFSILQTKYQLLVRSGELESAAKLLDDMIQLEELGEESKQRLIVRKALQLAGSQKFDAAIAELDRYLTSHPNFVLVQVSKGELLARMGKPVEALAVLEQAIALARLNPDVLIEAVAGKAEILFTTDQADLALQELDKFAEDTQMPTDLRCEAMLQQAMIMRKMGRRRPATLKENKAIETADSPALKRELLTVVEQIRAKAENGSEQ